MKIIMYNLNFLHFATLVETKHVETSGMSKYQLLRVNAGEIKICAGYLFYTAENIMGFFFKVGSFDSNHVHGILYVQVILTSTYFNETGLQ